MAVAWSHQGDRERAEDAETERAMGRWPSTDASLKDHMEVSEGGNIERILPRCLANSSSVAARWHILVTGMPSSITSSLFSSPSLHQQQLFYVEAADLWEQFEGSSPTTSSALYFSAAGWKKSLPAEELILSTHL